MDAEMLALVTAVSLGFGAITTYAGMVRRLRGSEVEAELAHTGAASPRREPLEDLSTTEELIPIVPAPDGALECGIELVSSDGRVVGTVLVPAPLPN